MEGNNLQRRMKARAARLRGRRPSEFEQTLGGSKQRAHVDRDEDHGAKVERRKAGKQPSALWRLGRH